MKTTVPRASEIKRAWHLVDASEKPLGRLAVRVADVLRGKHKPIYTAHVDTGDYVVVINARKVKLTGKKETQKIYTDFSGYRHGLKETKAAAIRARNPERMVYDAVRRMLPKNRLMRSTFKRLKVYPDAGHSHAAHAPQALGI